MNQRQPITPWEVALIVFTSMLGAALTAYAILLAMKSLAEMVEI